jgi:hypothetical protein
VTGDEVTHTHVSQLGLLFEAGFAGERAAGVEVAAGRWIGRTGDAPLRDDASARALGSRVRHRNGGEERLGVGVDRMVIEFVSSHLSILFDSWYHPQRTRLTQAAR